MLAEDVSHYHGEPPAQVRTVARTITKCFFLICLANGVCVCRMQDRVCIFFVLRDVRNGYLHVDWQRVIRRREQKQGDHSFFVLKKGNELRSLNSELSRREKQASSPIKQKASTPTHAFLLQVLITCHQREAMWLVFANLFVSCKTKCTLQKATKPVCQSSNFIAYHDIRHDSAQMNLLISFTWTQTGLDLILQLLYFKDNSSGHLKV